MATTIPPPSKRQRLLKSQQASLQLQEEPYPEGALRIRFVDRLTNEPVGPVIAVPLAQSSVKNLEVLVNSLHSIDDPADRIPYRFLYSSQSDSSAIEELSITENRDLYSSLVKTGKVNTEDELVLYFTPQAIFRVRAVSRCTSSILGHGQPILTAQFAPGNSSRLCTGSGDNTARIWDCDTSTPLHVLSGHTGWVLCIAYSPDGSMVATGSHDNTIRLWEAKSGQPLGPPFKGHTKFVRSLSWEPFHLEQEGRPRLASSSKDATVIIWDIVGRRADLILSGHKASVSCVKWGGTGLIYTASQDKTIKIWESTQGKALFTLQAHAHWVNHLALSTDFVLRTAFHDHTGIGPSTNQERIEKARERFNEAAIVNNQVVERLVSASDDSALYLWDPLGSNPTKPIARLLGHQKSVNHVTFSPDAMYIASSSFDNSIKLWNAQNGDFLMTLRGHVSPVYQSVFSPDSRLLVSGSKDTTLKCWDIRTGKIHTELSGHRDEVYAVDWSPDGRQVASGGKDKAVKLWRH